MKQNNQSSWAARLRKLSVLCLMLVASANIWATETLTIKPDVKAGETGTVTIALDNAKAFTAFQMQLTLPAGLSMESQGAMEILSTSSNHNVAYNYNPDDNVVTIVAYSFDGASSGNNAFNASGDLLVITVTADASYAGGEFVINQETDEKAPNYDKRLIFIAWEDLLAVTDFTIVNEQGEEILLGDVNKDGSINTQDILLIVDKILGETDPSFDEDAADLNSDGSINVQDILLIVDIILAN